MTVFEINSVPYGSTGRIMFQIADVIKSNGGTAYTSASYTKPRGEKFPAHYYRIGGMTGKTAHILLAKLTGSHGCYSHFATYRLIEKIKKVKPDIIHLHNIHGWYLNWPMLFRYLKQAGISVVWTLHDCWSFTGHCPHFMAVPCEKWKTQCYDCPLYKKYPGSFRDDSKGQYTLKKKCFVGVPNLTIVTPSQWLADLVKQSFLKDYHTVVIHNGIDLERFKPSASNFRKQYHLERKIILLGVAFDWGPRKGIEDFKRLAQELPEEYAIVLVGVSKRVADTLPERIVAIPCTQSQKELAQIYSASDLFVNPTLEDNFPTVNLEALACGTPVITYRTGGSPESLTDQCGKVVPYADYDALKRAVDEMKHAKSVMQQACRERAQLYGLDGAYRKYMELYGKCMKGSCE